MKTTIGRRRWTTLLAGLSAAILVMGPAAEAGVTIQTADVRGQGPAGPVVSVGGATLQRNGHGISVKLAMPTPEPGTYNYPTGNAFQPEGARPGHPEAFSLWGLCVQLPGPLQRTL